MSNRFRLPVQNVVMTERGGAARPGRTHVVTREPDMAALHQLLDGGGSLTCLVLAGEVGIGKTTLWESGLELAGEQGYLVLSARASQAEVSFSFASLADLVDDIDPDVLAGLPAPQVHALEVALRRRDPFGAVTDPFAVAAGFLSALRALAERGPVLVAVDDIQWLDRSSADALSFAARRLSGGGARFLVTRRSLTRSDLERVLQRSSVECL